MIAIIDYDAGNIKSVEKALEKLGEETCITRDKEILLNADKVILPGVGAFGDAMAKLRDSGLVPTLLEEAERKPLLGICLGMQLLFEESCEYGSHRGLGLIPGQVLSLKDALEDKSLKVPHMGWNSLSIKKDDPIFRYFEDGEYVYYVPSFYAAKCEESTLAVSDYGNVAVTGLVRRGMVWGSQFHPEKSGDAGLRLLKAFGEM